MQINSDGGIRFGTTVVTPNYATISLEDKYAALIALLDKIPHGKVTIFLQEGKPVRIEEAIRSTKL